MSHETELDPMARLLADALNNDPPPDVEAQMRKRLDSFRVQMESPRVERADRRPTRRWWYASAVTASAAAVLLAVVLLPLGSSSALAQIVEAVAAKTWLHASGTGPDGKPAEMWFSAQKGVMAFRAEDSYVFVDQIQGTMDVYGAPASTDSVQRVPLEYVPARGIDAAEESFRALLGGDLQQAMKADENRILEHSSKHVDAGGRELIEHRFVVGHPGRDDPRKESLLLVDPETDLPIAWRMQIGERVMFDFAVDYPERGPLTMAALGLPESVETIDLSPQGDFKQVLLATTAARRRFDDYHAVVVESMSPNRATAWDTVYRIWSKGDLWRVDICQPNFDIREEPPTGEDSRSWWLKQARSMKSYPREIWDGKDLWNYEPEYAVPRQQDPADPRFRLMTSLKATSRQVMDREDPQSNWFMLEIPEFYGYEHLNRGAQPGFRADARAVELDGIPMILVDILNTADESPKSISPHRYWLDPQRGDLIVRKEQFYATQPGQPMGASEVATAERTPQGLWYPTAVRLIGNTVSLEDNSRSDSYVRYYLEFDSEIPDELFSAESVDANNFWTATE